MLRRLSDIKARPKQAPSSVPQPASGDPVAITTAAPAVPRWQDLASRLTTHLTTIREDGHTTPASHSHAPSRPSGGGTSEDTTPSPGATP